jgi:hypothetical protein
MGAVTTAIEHLREARAELENEYERITGEIRSIDEAISTLTKSAVAPKTTSDVQSIHIRKLHGRPLLAERIRRRTLILDYAAKKRTPWDVLDFLRETGEPMTLRSVFRDLFSTLTAEGDLVRVRRGYYISRRAIT